MGDMLYVREFTGKSWAEFVYCFSWFDFIYIHERLKSIAQVTNNDKYVPVNATEPGNSSGRKP